MHKPLNKTRIVVGMSGGVDSSVSTYLLKKQGFDVHGLFMKNWEQDDTELYCHSAQDVVDAKQVADTIGIPITSVNFAKVYWNRVFQHFLAEYQAGRTPNPDILCNTEIKFKAFLEHAKTLGADKIATGHYARVIETKNEYQLHKANDLNKDQSYFLHGLNQQQLSQAVFPLGEMDKPTVRKIAQEQGFKNANKKDSTGICFIGERKFKTFLKDYLPAQPGDIVVYDTDKIIGTHEGLMYYTLGQRQGLGIGGVKDANEEPWYVVAKDLTTNRLLVVQGEHPALYSSNLYVQSIHWIGQPPLELPYRCFAKTRYRQVDQACTITQEETGFRVDFDQPQRAITPGQSVVFYNGSQCLGGGVIFR